VASDANVAGSRKPARRPILTSQIRAVRLGRPSARSFVGRVQGTDVGYAGETGAERRAQAAKEHRDSL
jgi:hypothetical protein